jgi:hypothetical protein
MGLTALTDHLFADSMCHARFRTIHSFTSVSLDHIANRIDWLMMAMTIALIFSLAHVRPSTFFCALIN